MRNFLRVAAILGIIITIIWWFTRPDFDPLYNFVASLAAFIGSFLVPDQELQRASLDKRNRRVMLNHVENFWIKGILEKSLHGAALLELGIKEDPAAVSYPWTIKKESTDEALPTGKSMLEIFQEVGMERSLLILGAPGSGKTTMLLELARQLIECARQDKTEPIPVIFNLASWTENQTLFDWLAEQLNVVYSVPRKIASSWVAADKMLLLLDGLDEVREDYRAKCVEAINRFRMEHGLISLVVCCRIEEYKVIQTKLAFDGAITLQPLTSEQIDTYIDRFGNGLTSVRHLLSKDQVARELAETPLMLSIMVLAYKDMKSEDLPSLVTMEGQRAHLFATYIRRMFERLTRAANVPFTKEQTLHYLSWLARAMIQNSTITYQIESMQPFWCEKQPPRYLYKFFVVLSMALIVGLPTGLIFGLIFGKLVGLITGLIFGLSASLTGEPTDEKAIIMVDRLNWRASWRGMLLVLAIPLLVGVFFALVSGLSGGLVDGLITGLYLGLDLMIYSVLAYGMTEGLMPEQVEETTYPEQRLKQTFSNALISTVILGLLVGVLAALLGGLLGGLFYALPSGLLLGLLAALFAGLTGGFSSMIEHYSLRWVLTKYDLLPHQLVLFLEYAVGLIFLRRVGGSYIFVHRLLMEHFAEMEV